RRLRARASSPGRKPLHIEKKFHAKKADHQNHHSDNERHWRNAIAPTGSNGTASNRRRRDGFRTLALLEVRVTVYRHALGIFESVQIRRHVNIQEFPIDKEETFRIRQTRELGKVVRLNFGQPLRSNLSHAGRFIEREISRHPCFLKFFTEALYSHERKAG